MKKMYVTIDTEMDADIKWKKKWPPEYSSILLGIPSFFRPIWEKYNVHPIYFLSPEVLYSDACVKVIRDEVRRGAVIGAHLHPEYIDPHNKIVDGRQKERSEFPCSDYDYETEKQKIHNLTHLIQSKIGVRPVWYRAARFGADEDTYKILNELGYEHESSVTPGIDWSTRGGIDYTHFGRECYTIQGTSIVEHPITIEGKRFGVLGKFFPNNWLFYNWLRPTHMTYWEMKKIVKKYSGTDNAELVMMFHSMEPMVNKTPYVRNEAMKRYYYWRLERIIRFADKEGYSL